MKLGSSSKFSGFYTDILELTRALMAIFYLCEITAQEGIVNKN